MGNQKESNLRAAALAADPGRKFLRTALVICQIHPSKFWGYLLLIIRNHRPVLALVILKVAVTLFSSVPAGQLEKRLPDRKAPWHGRTEKHEHCIKKFLT